MTDRYLELDECSDALASLQELNRQLERIRDDARAWKWAAIAMVSALNSALVCNLSGTAQVGALERKCAKKTLEALQQSSSVSMPEPFLASTKTMLERVGGRSERLESAGGDITIDDDQLNRLHRLLEFRNEFLHFKPVGWSIEVSGMPDLMLSALDLVKQLHEDPWSFRHQDETDRIETNRLIVEIATGLKQIHLRV